MTAAQLRDALWNLCSTADVCQRYHQRTQWIFGWLDRAAKILVGLLATLALAMAIAGERMHEWDVTTAAVAAFAAVLLNVIPFGEWSSSHAELFRAWTDLRIYVESLHGKVERLPDGPVPDCLLDRFDELNAKQFQLDGQEPHPNRKRLERCQGDSIESKWGAGIRTAEQADAEMRRRLTASAAEGAADSGAEVGKGPAA